MIGVVVAAHGTLAESLLATAMLVMRETAQVVALSILPEDDAQSFELRFRQTVETLQKHSEGVLLLTDMFGGTPSNIGMTLHERGKVEILTGVNLPMLIKVLQLMPKQTDLLEVARQARKSAAQSIAIASEVLAGPATTLETAS